VFIRDKRTAQVAALIATGLMLAFPPSGFARNGTISEATAMPYNYDDAISMSGCFMTLHLFKDSAERLGKWVPDPNRYKVTGTVPGQPDQAWLTFWFYSCRDLAINGGRSRPANLSLVAVVVKKPEGRGTRPWYDPLFNAPIDFDSYLVWAHTDHEELAGRLRQVGMPVHRAREVRFERANEFEASTFVLSDAGTYSSKVMGSIDDTLHHHDNSFWHWRRPFGEAQLRIQIGSPEHPTADDRGCKDSFTIDIPISCSSVSAEGGSEVATLLGAPMRDDSAAFNHLEFDAVAFIRSYD
jgi:hypothetical protein